MNNQSRFVSVTSTTISLPSSDHPKDNPYPMFREFPKNHVVETEGAMGEEDKVLFGFENGSRSLPYKKKDTYSRRRQMMSQDAIILENDHLKATFLPQYGGRLYSLFQKDMNQELLFSNSVIQPANLAILDAWISGGIEWNIGQLGHTFTTCQPLFCSVLMDGDGNEFLRMFEYERCHQIFWHIDVHLRPDSSMLEIYVRIVNDGKEPASTYWWTNTAVPETEETRIFSGANKLIYLNMENLKYGVSTMPELPFLPETDISYPKNFSFSEEYFFQESGEAAPWEAAVYKDWAFFERSSSVLAYRKMFCWGNQPGGHRWKDYLSEPGKGDYIEIQAGLSKTQRHGLILDAGNSIEFVQCFGGFFKDQNAYFGANWKEEQANVKATIEALVSTQEVEQLLSSYATYKEQIPVRFLSYGSGFGALEALRRRTVGENPIPKGFFFPTESMGVEQDFWRQLLEGELIFDKKETGIPASYMIEASWKQMLEAYVQEKGNDSYEAALHLGIMAMEEEDYQTAHKQFTKASEIATTALCYRNLACLCQRQEQLTEAENYYKMALDVANQIEESLVAQEYLRLLAIQKNWRQMYQVFQSCSEETRKEERIYLLGVQAALGCDDLNFVKEAFEKEYAYIRESETSLSDIWLQYHQRLETQRSGERWTLAEVENTYPIPYELDFRMILK